MAPSPTPSQRFGVFIVEATENVSTWGKVVNLLFNGNWKSGTNWALFFGRLALGFLFIWGGYTKMGAWANGGRATKGFLGGASVDAGPLAAFFHSLAGNWTVEYITVYGEFLIGVALIFGLFVRVGAVSAALMMRLFTVAMWPIADTAGANPLVDIRVIYGLMALGFFFTKPGLFLGVDGIIEKFLPKNVSKLKLLLG